MEKVDLISFGLHLIDQSWRLILNYKRISVFNQF